MSSWITSIWAKEVRDLLNQYDPEGMIPANYGTDKWIQTEDASYFESYYDKHHKRIIEHLNKGSSHSQIFRDLKNLIIDHPALIWDKHHSDKTTKFVDDILLWFETKKPELKK